jgi:hypothetical protein
VHHKTLNYALNTDQCFSSHLSATLGWNKRWENMNGTYTIRHLRLRKEKNFEDGRLAKIRNYIPTHPSRNSLSEKVP